MRRLTAVSAAVLAVIMAVSAASQATAPHPQRPRDPTQPLVVLTIGDSLTADGRWQAEFSRLAMLAGQPVTIINTGIGGSDCYSWTTRISGQLAQYNPDMVSVNCGTNDDANATVYSENRTAWSYRTIVEKIRNYRPSDPIKIIPHLIGYSDQLIAPQWLLDFEPRTNDALYSAIMMYYPAGWFTGIANNQVIPNSATYLDSGGIHYTDRGYKYMGRIAYNASGLPATLEPPPCDLYGHRKGYGRPGYTPCPT